MPSIIINYLSPFSKIIGKKEEILQVDSSDTVQTLLVKLSAKYGDAFKNEIFDSENKIKNNLGLMVNGVRMDELNKAFGQRLDIFLLLSGGY